MTVTHTVPLVALMPLLPLAGALLGYGVTNRDSSGLSGWIATLWAFISFLAALFCFLVLQTSGAGALVYDVGQWFAAGNLQVSAAFRLDNLAAVMALVVTGIGSLIHLYAIGYMADDDSRPRFFAYLNLFLCAMLVLVLADNLLVMFVGWEGVGLCSYLLIGFWYKAMPNAQAGQKAFVVNRIGDAGFLLGIFTLYAATNSVDFGALEAAVPGLGESTIELAALLLFIGAVGKSAQIPLYVWLPDAMAGPTPVSALIHAATMVTAGVFMTARMSFLYEHAEMTRTVILGIGAATALVAASIALVQNDIKKVLAYSTVSQLGYMFMGIGAAAFSCGIYHVVTHAFFKACLFLGAGSVIMGCHHEQDMRKFGGLWKSMPVTFVTFLAAVLAIAGVPGLSGAHSKDAVLWAVFSNQTAILGPGFSLLCWFIGVFTAMLTAYYMTRCLVLTFFGSYRGSHHPHESKWIVTLPLVCLAIPALGFGALHGEELLLWLEPWTRPDLRVTHEVLAATAGYHQAEMAVSVVALCGVAFGLLAHAVFPAVAQGLAGLFPGLHRALAAKWWVDEFYDAVIVRPLRGTAAVLYAVADKVLVDGSVNGAGAWMKANSDVVRRFHTGQTAHYLCWMFASCLLILVVWLVPKWIG